MDAALILLILGVIIALAVGGYLWMRSRSPEDESFYHFLCPGCRYRLRYQARQVGHPGKCSRCGAILTFPPIEESID